MKLFTLLIGSVFIVVITSGCTALDAVKDDINNAIPKDTTYELNYLSIPDGVSFLLPQHCEAELINKYPSIGQAECIVTNVDEYTNTFDCKCTVHSGVI